MVKTEYKGRRRTLLIQRVFQTKFISLFISLIILSSALSGLFLYQRTNTELGYHYGQAHSKLKKTGEILLPNLLVGNIIAVILIGSTAIALTLLISNKIAGPLYRFEKNAEQIAKGDFTINTTLRHSDQIKGLADSFSKMTNELREKMVGLRTHAEELPSVIEEMKRLSKDKKIITPQELAVIADKLSGISSHLQDSLKNFKL